MARLARVMAQDMPHHVTQQGNPRQQTFFGEADYQHYLELISRFCRRAAEREKGTSLNSDSLAPKPLASSVYVRVPEAVSLTNGRYQ